MKVFRMAAALALLAGAAYLAGPAYLAAPASAQQMPNINLLGDGPGKLAMVIAPGMDHPLLQASAPYDLVIANILAGPLVELAPDFARALNGGGHLLLAGLLTVQEPAVRRACRRAGLRLAARMQRGDWSILWLRRRKGVAVRHSRVGPMPEWSKGW